MEDQVYPVLRSCDDGFALSSVAPQLSCMVEFCDRAKLLYGCLIPCSGEEGCKMVYECKRMTKASEGRILGFVQMDDAPAACLPAKSFS